MASNARTVKDVSPHDFVKSYAAHLKRSGKQLLMEKLDEYESAVGDLTPKSTPRIEAFPPSFQAVPRNPIVLDLAYNTIEFPSLDHRMKKEVKGFISRLWR